MTLIEKLDKEASYTISLAVKSFLDKNFLKEDQIIVTVLDKQHKCIIRVPSWTVDKNRDAEHTIYHGWRFDVFTWTCHTRSSGTLEYDDCLSDEYRYKCSE